MNGPVLFLLILLLVILIFIIMYPPWTVINDDIDEEETTTTTTTTITDDYPVLYSWSEKGLRYVTDPVDKDKVEVQITDDMYEDGKGTIWRLV